MVHFTILFLFVKIWFTFRRCNYRAKNIYTCRYDRAFKEVFMKENNKDILITLLESILKVKIELLEYLNREKL